jgi:DNA-binding NarL/FixJ family response regulator
VKPIRIVLADAQSLFRSSLADFFNSVPETEIVAESCTGKEAICLAETYQPDIILTDIQLPDMDGLTLIQQIGQNQPAVGIIALTLVDQEKIVWAAIQAGAKGYLLKGCSRPELLTTVTSVSCGQVVFGSEVVKCVAGQAASRMLIAAGYNKDPIVQLTKREQQILARIGLGLSNCEIACELRIKERTVEFHVGNILKKLGVASRVQAAVLWSGGQDLNLL